MVTLPKWLTGRRGDAPEQPVFATVQRVQQLFVFGHAEHCIGLNLSEETAQGLERLISWSPEPRAWTIRVATKSHAVGDQIVIPPHITWSANPQFRYIGVVDGRLEFRAGAIGESAYFVAPVTTDPAVIGEIDALFKSWYERLQLDGPTPSLPKGLISVTSESPINGFKVLDLAYPNHLAPTDPPYTARELAILLSRDMDNDWFGEDAAFEHFNLTYVERGAAPHEDAFWFNFGPAGEVSEAAETSYTVIVRETAGGGFMLLLQNSGVEYAEKIKSLFRAVLETGDRAAAEDYEQ